MRTTILVLLALLLIPLTASADGKDWKKLKRDFEKGIASSDSAERIAALQSVNGVNDWEMVKLVLKAMEDESDKDVIDAAVYALGAISKESPVNTLVKQIEDDETSDKVAAIGARGLWRIPLDHAKEQFAALLKDPKNHKLVWAATEAIDILPPSGAIFDVVKKNTRHAVKEVRVASVHALNRCADDDVAVNTLIDVLGGAGPRVKQDINVLLRQRLDAQGYDDPNLWRQHYKAFKDGTEGPSEDATPPKTVLEAPTYYKVPIYAKNVIFVLDRTGSMEKEISAEFKEKVKEEIVVSGGGKQEVEGKGEKQHGEDLPWDRIDTKMDLAKEELKRVINTLPEDTYFNVIYYNIEVVAIEKKLVPASASNKKKMIKKIDSLDAEAGTDAFFDALTEATAYTRGGKIDAGSAVFTDDGKKEGNDVIFFLTDGSPTIDSGATIMPETMIQEKLGKFMDAWQATKPVVNTIGIGPHPRGLMKGIADKTGGIYVDLSFN
jgi:hypothetical protein